MKKILLILSSVLLAGYMQSTPAPTPTASATSAPTATPKVDATTSPTYTTEDKKFGDVELGVEDAKKIVMDKEPNVSITKIELDDDHGRMVYDIDATLEKREYDIKIDANTGEIIKWHYDD